MTTYKTIRGTHIVSVTSDPPSPVNGQMWYNSTDKVVKGFKISNVGSWSTGGSLNTARSRLAGNGTQTSGIAFGGKSPSPGYRTETEQYNGTSWTETGDLNSGRNYFGGAAADNTSALAFAGDAHPNTYLDLTESFNGSAWTEVNDLNQSRYGVGGMGITTAALCFGGYKSGGRTAETESWNGSSWTEVNDLNTAKAYLAGAGVYDSGLAISGESAASPTGVTDTEVWNGTSWTEVNNVNTKRWVAGAGGINSGTGALFFGGYLGPPGATGVTEDWNGTSWTEVADLSQARYGLAGAGNSTLGLAFGGNTGSAKVSTTDEWSGTTPSTVTFTVS